MIPSCFQILSTALRVQAAMSTTCIDLAYRLASRAGNDAEGLVESIADVLRGPEGVRQAAVEDAIWTAYMTHEQMVRAMAGTSSLSLLVFLNELDLRRGRHSPPRGP